MREIPAMLLIDIINELQFGGSGFVPALAAARRRAHVLNPLLRRVLRFAAERPGAFEHWFSARLLAAAAYLLAEARDPEFLTLAAPLITAEGPPNILGEEPDDLPRLIEKALGSDLAQVVPAVSEEPLPPEGFTASALPAVVLAVHRSPALAAKAVAAFRALLAEGRLGNLTPELRNVLVDCCCRLDPANFLLGFQLAILRGELDEASTMQAVEDAAAQPATVAWVGDWEETAPLGPTDWYLQRHWRFFEADDLRRRGSPPASAKALAAFNRLATPSRNVAERLAATTPTRAVIEVATRVVLLAVRDPYAYLEDHLPFAVSLAVCLAAPTGDPGFAAALLRLLRLPEDDIEALLGEGLTNLGEWALVAATRHDPSPLYRLALSAQACAISRGGALRALASQVMLGLEPRERLSRFCRKTLGRWREVSDERWFWMDFAHVCARLDLLDLLPGLQALSDEINLDDGIHTVPWEIDEDEGPRDVFQISGEDNDPSPSAIPGPLDLLPHAYVHKQPTTTAMFLACLKVDDAPPPFGSGINPFVKRRRKD